MKKSSSSKSSLSSLNSLSSIDTITLINDGYTRKRGKSEDFLCLTDDSWFIETDIYEKNDLKKEIKKVRRRVRDEKLEDKSLHYVTPDFIKKLSNLLLKNKNK